MKFYLVVLFFALSFLTLGQTKTVVLKSANTRKAYSPLSSSEIRFDFNINKIDFSAYSTPVGDFEQISIDGSYPYGKPGEPELAKFSRLFLIPKNAEVLLKDLSFSQESVLLPENDINNPIFPHQESRVKSPADSITFVFKPNAYVAAIQKKQPEVKLEQLGNIGNYTLCKISVYPLQYNFPDAQLDVFNQISIILETENVKSPSVKSGLLEQTLLYKYPYVSTQYTREKASSSRNMLVIVPDSLLPTLQLWLKWKSLTGMNVTVGKLSEIGNTSTKIRAYILEHYRDTTFGGIDYLLLVGDIGLIPASQTGAASLLPTDVYYASPDGDFLPDFLIGRWPVNNNSQLQAIMDKSLYYEQYKFSDATYLDKATLIAGADPTWNKKVAQPTIQYATVNYFNKAKGFSNVYEFLTSYTNCYRDTTLSVGIVNYTAHCTEWEWTSPGLYASTINGLQNENRYPLVIGNCCSSADFSKNQSIGEEWVLKSKGGAFAYIGSVPETYWWEDFYWAVGAHSPVYNQYPTVAGSGLGLYDAAFLTEQVSIDMLKYFGNLAVTEAIDSNYTHDVPARYYWEAYHTLGDPSIIPFLKQGKINTVQLPESIHQISTSFEASGISGSRIGITQGDSLITAGTFDANGVFYFEPGLLPSSDSLTVCVTKGGYIPFIKKIAVTPLLPPDIEISEIKISNSRNENLPLFYYDTLQLKLQLTNKGEQKAQNIRVHLDMNNYNFGQYADSLFIIPEILPGQSTANISALRFTCNKGIRNLDSITINFTVQDDYMAASDSLISCTLSDSVLAPEIVWGTVPKILDNDFNNNGILEFGESGFIELMMTNAGLATVSPTITLTSLDENSFIHVGDTIQTLGSIAPGDSTLMRFPVSIDSLSLTSLQSTFLLHVEYCDTAIARFATSYRIPIGKPLNLTLGKDSVEQSILSQQGRIQMLFDKNKISTNGSKIESLSLYAKSMFSVDSLLDFTINIGTSTESIVENQWLLFDSKLNAVQSKKLALPLAEGWFTIPFDSLFSFSGNENLLLELSWSGTSSGNAPQIIFESSLTERTMTAFGLPDSNTPDSSSLFRPNIRLGLKGEHLLTLRVKEKTAEALPIAGAIITLGNDILTSNNEGIADTIFSLPKFYLNYSANKSGYYPVSGIIHVNELLDTTLYLIPVPDLQLLVCDSLKRAISNASTIWNGKYYHANEAGIIVIKDIPIGSSMQLQINANGFYSGSIHVTMPDKDSTISVTLQHKADLQFSIFDSASSLAKASIQLSGNMMDTTLVSDSLGLAALHDLNTGMYHFTVSHAHYFNAEGDFLLTHTDTIINVTLSALPNIKFTISDGTKAIEQALVELDNTQIKTDSLGIAQFTALQPGKYTYRVSKGAYYSLSDSLILHNFDTSIVVRLQAKPQVTILVHDSVQVLPDVTVLLNNNVFKTNAEGLLPLGAVDSGLYSIKVQFSDYYLWQNNVHVQSDSMIDILLQRQKFMVQLSASCNGVPEPGVSIILDSLSFISDSLGKAPDFWLYNGNYTVQAAKPHFVSEAATLNVNFATQAIDLPLSKNNYLVQFVLSNLDGFLVKAPVTINNLEYQSDELGTISLFPLNYPDTIRYLTHVEKYYPLSDTFVVVSDTTVNLMLDYNSQSDFVRETIHLYPNPVKNELEIVHPNLQNGKLNILDWTGRCLIEYSIKGTHSVVDVTKLNAGTYMVLIIDEDKQFCGTIIKK